LLKVDATILEVGIGGLLDDTNIVPQPIVTGVSSIGYDHMNVLGNTLKDIAYQKGGIFKVS
jgi:folylpolyglutamate synthase